VALTDHRADQAFDRAPIWTPSGGNMLTSAAIDVFFSASGQSDSTRAQALVRLGLCRFWPQYLFSCGWV